MSFIPGLSEILNYAKPKIYMSWSGTKVKLWNWLEGEIGNQNGTFVLNQTYLAEKFGVSRTAVINALKTFVVADAMTTKVDNLIDRLEEVRKKKGLPKARFGPDELGVAKVTYRKWTYREYEPNAENTINIIDYLEKNED